MNYWLYWKYINSYHIYISSLLLDIFWLYINKVIYTKCITPPSVQLPIKALRFKNICMFRRGVINHQNIFAERLRVSRPRTPASPLEPTNNICENIFMFPTPKWRWKDYHLSSLRPQPESNAILGKRNLEYGLHCLFDHRNLIFDL